MVDFSFSPHIILVKPQLGENIGMAARAMGNCGVSSLILVEPRDGWPNPAALSAAAGAEKIIQNASLWKDIPQATKKVKRIYAMTARRRSRALLEKNLAEAAQEIVENQKRGILSAVLFGPERSGLDNEMVSCADTLVHIPLEPDFSSVNLGQSVMLFCYEWRKASHGRSAENPAIEIKNIPADKEELFNFINRLEKNLEECRFFKTPEMRQETLRNLRAFFQRAQPNAQELKTLHGVITRLSSPR